MTYKYLLRGVETDIEGAGTHIHTGTSCDVAEEVGGHYWDDGEDGTIPDPWNEKTTYSTNEKGIAKGAFELNSGIGFDDNIGRAVVVHASDGSRIGCGILQTNKAKNCKGTAKPKTQFLQGCVGPYPGSDSKITGKIVVAVDTETSDLKYNYVFKNVEKDVEGAGTHIHTGTSCDVDEEVGGHYWDDGEDGTIPDPWNDVTYDSNKRGKAKGVHELNNGHDFDDNFGRAVVVHASDGSRIGCGVLDNKKGKCGGKGKKGKKRKN
jgi:hypothetical protein